MVLTIVAKFLHNVKLFVPHFAPPANRLGVGKRLGMDTTKMADLHWPEGLCHIVSCSAIKPGGRGQSSKGAIAWRLAGRWQAHGRWWAVAFVSLGFFSLHSLNCQDLAFALWIPFPILLGKEETRGWWVLSCYLGSSHYIQINCTDRHSE